LKKILITGSSGFIGSHLSKKLKTSGYEVIEISKSKGIDITNLKKLKSLDLKNIDIVFHLAALTSSDKDAELYKTNVLGTLNILELCKIKKIKKIIFNSSYVYGHPKYLPINESHPLNPTNPYSISKFLSELLCNSYTQNNNLNIIILRLANIYGSNQKGNFLIPAILNQLKNSEILLSNPHFKRDFLHVDDLIKLYLKLIDTNIKNETFNIGSGANISIIDLANKIKKLSKSNATLKWQETINQNQRRENEVKEVLLNISKAKQLLDWQPSISIDEGLGMIFSDS